MCGEVSGGWGEELEVVVGVPGGFEFPGVAFPHGGSVFVCGVEACEEEGCVRVVGAAELGGDEAGGWGEAALGFEGGVPGVGAEVE